MQNTLHLSTRHNRSNIQSHTKLTIQSLSEELYCSLIRKTYWFSRNVSDRRFTLTAGVTVTATSVVGTIMRSSVAYLTAFSSTAIRQFNWQLAMPIGHFNNGISSSTKHLMAAQNNYPKMWTLHRTLPKTETFVYKMRNEDESKHLCFIFDPGNIRNLGVIYNFVKPKEEWIEAGKASNWCENRNIQMTSNEKTIREKNFYMFSFREITTIFD